MRSTMRNQGARVDGPWVFRFILGNDCRYFVVKYRDRQIHPHSSHKEGVLTRLCDPLRRMDSIFFVDRQRLSPQYLSIINRITLARLLGITTRQLSGSWLDAKISILKRKRDPYTSFKVIRASRAASK